MYDIKLPYYPKVVSRATETRFGVLEITTPAIYDSPLPIADTVIYKVDTLQCLRKQLGELCTRNRDAMYSIISGAGDEAIYRARLATFYKTYPDFTKLVNFVYEHGDSAIPLTEQVPKYMKSLIDLYSKHVSETLYGAGGKYLITTHLYMYFKFVKGATMPELEGATIIC